MIGIANPADMLTKHLAIPDLDRHLEFSGLIISTGRAEGSVHVNALERRGTLNSVDISSRGARIARALASAAHSYYMCGTSKVGIPPWAVGGYTSHDVR